MRDGNLTGHPAALLFQARRQPRGLARTFGHITPQKYSRRYSPLHQISTK